MVAGAAGDDLHLLDAAQVAHDVEVELAIEQTAFQGVGDGVKGCSDFFEHVVAKLRLYRLRRSWRCFRGRRALTAWSWLSKPGGVRG